MSDQTDSRFVEHRQSQDGGLARASSTHKKSSAPPKIHPGMKDRVSDTAGAAPTGRPADAVSPSLYSTQQAGKSFPIPEASWDMKGGDGQDVDRSAAHRVMGETVSSPDDFARSLHTKLPESTTEN
ncbi:MAG: hypothetical protein ACRD9W_10625 [Terriglobia bacterium]